MSVQTSNFIKLSDELTLFSGDLINLRADDGTFLKRYHAVNGHDALLCYQKNADVYSNFTVEVVGSDKIRLIADDGNYCKRHYSWEGKSFISIDLVEPDAYSDFTVISRGGNGVSLKADNGQLLKRYFGFKGMSIITAYMAEEDPPYSTFRVERIGTKFDREVVENIEFDQSKLRKSLSPFIVGTQTLTNSSNVQQTMTFVVNKKVQTTKSFEWDFSFKIGAETKFKAGIPLIASNTTTVNVETGFTLGGSRSDSEEQLFEASFPVICPSKTAVQAIATVQLGRVDVPYVATISRYLMDGTGTTRKYTYQVERTFTGTNAFDLTAEFTEIPLRQPVTT